MKGQAALISFARSLSDLAAEHDICVLLLNGTVPVFSPHITPREDVGQIGIASTAPSAAAAMVAAEAEQPPSPPEAHIQRNSSAGAPPGDILHPEEIKAMREEHPLLPTTQQNPSLCPPGLSSRTEKPALGNTFTYCIDTHVLLSRVPLDNTPASLDSDPGAGRMATGSGIGNASRDMQRDGSVYEILADRFSDRMGRWGRFYF